MIESAEVAILQSRRRKTLDNPSPQMEHWAKRVHGLVEQAGPGEIVRLPEKTRSESACAIAKPAYDVKISHGAKLDYRDPKIPPGLSRDLKPESCPPRSRKLGARDKIRHWLPQFESRVRELEKSLVKLKKNSDHNSKFIPEVARDLELMRKCAQDLRAML